jgi:hypothetical protein
MPNRANVLAVVIVASSAGWIINERPLMLCPSCRVGNSVEFASEMMLHFVGLKNVNNPGVWLFSRVLICLVCGVARFSVPEAELASLAAGHSDTGSL